MKKQLVLYLTIFLLLSCNKSTNEFERDDQFFTINTQIKNYDSCVSCTYQSKYYNKGITYEFSIKKNNDGDLVIRYDDERFSNIIVVRKINDLYKSFYYSIEKFESNNLTGINKLIVRSNLEVEKFSKIYPYAYGEFQQMRISDIIIDFNYEIQNLAFFNQIEIIFN